MCRAFDALVQAGFDGLKEVGGHGNIEYSCATHSAKDLDVSVRFRHPNTYAFGELTQVTLMGWAIYDDCLRDLTTEEQAIVDAFLDKYSAKTFMSLSTEYTYIAWDDKTGYDGFLRYVKDEAHKSWVFIQ